MAHLMGIAEADGDLFRRWMQQMLEASIDDMSSLQQALAELSAYFTVEIEKRQARPAEDLITRLMSLDIEGRYPLAPKFVAC